FFLQAEDGIRDFHVTGVQTCALPISRVWCRGLADFQVLLADDVRRAHILFSCLRMPSHPADQTTAVMPPSTKMFCPDTKLDASEARNSSAPVSSAKDPHRPAGVRCVSHALKASSSTRARFITLAK